MNNVNKELPRALTIEDLKSRVGKPIFVIATTEEFKNETRWYILSKINEFKADNKNRGYIEFTDCNYIDLKKIQFFRFFDTEVSATELKEILDAEEKAKKKTGYEVVDEGVIYFYVSDSLHKEKERFTTKYRVDLTKSTFVNHFIVENLVEKIARAERLKYQLRRYAALNGGIPSPKYWQSLESKKNYISYDCVNNKLSIYDRQILKEFGQIYFKSKEACEKAIEIFKDELIWYFTEFQEQLY